MVDESRFRYRRDGGSRDDGDAGARVPSAREGAPYAQDPRQAPARQAPQVTARQEGLRQGAASQGAPGQMPSRADAARLDAARAEPGRPASPRQGQPQAPAREPAAPLRQAAPPRAPQPPRDLPPQDAPAARPAPARPAPAAARPAARLQADGGVDPLAELARLIGEQDPFVDFADLQAEAPAARAPAAPVSRADPRTAPRADARAPETRQQDPRLQDPRTQALRADAARGQDPRLARRQPEAGQAGPAGELPAPRVPARPAAPRQAIARVGQDPTQVRAPAPDSQAARPDPQVRQDQSAARAAAPAPQARRPDVGFGEADFADPTRRPPPRPAAAPDLPPRQAALAAPPQRAALLPPRGDGEPVDRSATSVRLGYGSLAHQAQVAAQAAHTGRRAPDPRALPDVGDDYEPMAPRPAPSAEPRRPAAAPAQSQAYAQPPQQEASAAYAYSAPRRADGEDDYEEYDEAYDPQYGEDGYMPPHGEEVFDGEARRRKGRTALLMVASVLGIIIAGTAGVFAYRMAVHGSPAGTSGGAPVIRADTAPSKIVPPPNSAPQDAQQKLIYDRVGGAAPGSEKMLPREEQPVDVNAAAVRGTQPAATDPVINSLATEPKRVRTLTVRSDGTIAPEGAPAAPTAAPSAGSPSLAAYTATQMPGAPPPMLHAPSASTKIDAPPVSRTGDFVVQVASQRSEADALGSWKALQTRYPNLLGSYAASVKKADLGDRGIYYRAQVGPFASKDQANELCQALRAQGGDCMVTKN